MKSSQNYGSAGRRGWYCNAVPHQPSLTSTQRTSTQGVSTARQPETAEQKLNRIINANKDPKNPMLRREVDSMDLVAISRDFKYGANGATTAKVNILFGVSDGDKTSVALLKQFCFCHMEDGELKIAGRDISNKDIKTIKAFLAKAKKGKVKLADLKGFLKAMYGMQKVPSDFAVKFFLGKNGGSMMADLNGAGLKLDESSIGSMRSPHDDFLLEMVASRDDANPQTTISATADKLLASKAGEAEGKNASEVEKALDEASANKNLDTVISELKDYSVNLAASKKKGETEDKTRLSGVKANNNLFRAGNNLKTYLQSIPENQKDSTPSIIADVVAPLIEKGNYSAAAKIMKGAADDFWTDKDHQMYGKVMKELDLSDKDMKGLMGELKGLPVSDNYAAMLDGYVAATPEASFDGAIDRSIAMVNDLVSGMDNVKKQEMTVKVITKMSPDNRLAVLKKMSPKVVAAVFSGMWPDEAAVTLTNLGIDQAVEVLSVLSKEKPEVARSIILNKNLALTSPKQRAQLMAAIPREQAAQIVDDPAFVFDKAEDVAGFYSEVPETHFFILSSKIKTYSLTGGTEIAMKDVYAVATPKQLASMMAKLTTITNVLESLPKNKQLLALKEFANAKNAKTVFHAMKFLGLHDDSANLRMVGLTDKGVYAGNDTTITRDNVQDLVVSKLRRLVKDQPADIVITDKQITFLNRLIKKGVITLPITDGLINKGGTIFIPGKGDRQIAGEDVFSKPNGNGVVWINSKGKGGPSGIMHFKNDKVARIKKK